MHNTPNKRKESTEPLKAPQTPQPGFTAVTTPGQVRETVRLAKLIWHEHYTPIIGSEQVDYMLETFQSVEAIGRQIESEGYRYFLVELEGLPLGYFSLQQRESSFFISKLYLLREFRRKGYGRRSVRFIEQLAREAGIDRLALTVNRHNLDTLKAYKKLGFRRTGEQVQEIGNGYVMDDYLYEKQVISLPIIYRDEHFIAVNKPSGLLVHRSMIDKSETDFAMQILRDQIAQYVYPVHRLDKPTSGVLLFALSPEAAKAMGEVFEAKGVQKEYLAVVRGYTDASGTIDYPLKEQLDKMTDARADHDKPPQDAVTLYTTLKRVELPYPVSRYPVARYSLVRLFPQTGRKHQLRRHMKHLLHPIVGDTKYGRNEHNRLFREKFDSHRLLLHADKLTFLHPYTGKCLTIHAPLDDTMRRVFESVGFAG